MRGKVCQASPHESYSGEFESPIFPISVPRISRSVPSTSRLGPPPHPPRSRSLPASVPRDSRFVGGCPVQDGRSKPPNENGNGRTRIAQANRTAPAAPVMVVEGRAVKARPTPGQGAASPAGSPLEGARWGGSPVSPTGVALGNANPWPQAVASDRRRVAPASVTGRSPASRSPRAIGARDRRAGPPDVPVRSQMGDLRDSSPHSFGPPGFPPEGVMRCPIRQRPSRLRGLRASVCPFWPDMMAHAVWCTAEPGPAGSPLPCVRGAAMALSCPRMEPLGGRMIPPACGLARRRSRVPCLPAHRRIP